MLNFYLLIAQLCLHSSTKYCCAWEPQN